MFRVKNPQDLGAGLVFVLIGLAGLYFGKDLTYGTAHHMGPGYFPTWLNFLIVVLGVVVGSKAFAIEGPRIEPVRLRPILFIVAAIMAFGFLVNAIGLALAAVLLTILSAYARRGVNLKETILLGIGLAVFSVVVFVYVLGQALPVWWGR